jgi:uncharacterized protein with beta-barrel porin domain
MIQQTGKIMSTQLHAAAKGAYLKSSKTLNDSSSTIFLLFLKIKYFIKL